ncbi:rod shape-determining protein MreD [Patescibacteria group bacterium]|nr:rod shape-determining protein MreD [Patescibacteria group bacterium]
MVNKKNRYYIFALVLFIFLFLQITFLPQTFSNLYSPNIVLILLIAFAVADKSEYVLFFSFICGIIFDIVSIKHFGSTTISMIFTMFIILYLCSVFLKKTLSYNLFLVSIIGVVAYNIIYVFLININNLSTIISNASNIILIILFQTIISLVLIFPITNFFSCKNEK